MSDRGETSRKASSASGSTSSSGSSQKKRGRKSTVHEKCRMDSEKPCEECQKKMRNVGYQEKSRKKKAALQKPTGGKECQQCADRNDEIASLQAEVARLKALLEGLCDGCYDKLDLGTPDLDDVAAGETVVSAPEVSVYEASEVGYAKTTTAAASQLSIQQATSSTAYALPMGTFGGSVVRHTSFVPPSAVNHCSTLSVEEVVYRLQELRRQTGHVAYVLRNTIVLTVENPQPLAPVNIHTAINLDGLFFGAHYSGYMFRVLESFYHFGLKLTEMLTHTYLRYIKPSNIVLHQALDHFPMKAYYSMLWKTYDVMYEPWQLDDAPIPAIPAEDARYVAPEVTSGEPYDVPKAVAYSFGVCLYDMFTVTMGMKHIVNKDFPDQNFIVEGTSIRHPDGSASIGLYSVNPAIIRVIWSLIQAEPAFRGRLEDFTQLFTTTSIGQMDTTITGAKPVEPNVQTDLVCFPIPAPPPTPVSPISYAPI